MTASEFLAFVIARRKAKGYYRRLPVTVKLPCEIRDQIRLWYDFNKQTATEP